MVPAQPCRRLGWIQRPGRRARAVASRPRAWTAALRCPSGRIRFGRLPRWGLPWRRGISRRGRLPGWRLSWRGLRRRTRPVTLVESPAIHERPKSGRAWRHHREQAETGRKGGIRGTRRAGDGARGQRAESGATGGPGLWWPPRGRRASRLRRAPRLRSRSLRLRDRPGLPLRVLSVRLLLSLRLLPVLRVSGPRVFLLLRERRRVLPERAELPGGVGAGTGDM